MCIYTHLCFAYPSFIEHSSGVAWYTPVRTFVRWKTEIRKIEKPTKLKNAIEILVKLGLGVKL